MTVIAPFASKYLRAARSIPETGGRPQKHLTSEQKMIARRLARDGASVEKIRDALGVNMSLATLRRRLLEANIRNSSCARRVR